MTAQSDAAAQWRSAHVRAGTIVYGNDEPNAIDGRDRADLNYQDRLYGGRGDDSLRGLQGVDHLYGDIGVDTLDGGNGDDYLEGGGDNDYLIGNASNDYLVGGLGQNTLNGGHGDDLLLAMVDGDYSNGLGVNTANYASARGGLIVDLRVNDFYADLGYASSASTGYDLLGGILNVIGSFQGDTIYGNYMDNLIEGQGGNDFLYGGVGEDTLHGNTGFDYARYDDANHGNLVISLKNPSANRGAASGDVYWAVEGVVGGGGHDTITGDDAGNALIGKGGDDMLYGGYGADSMSGDGGFDYARYDDAYYGDLVISLGVPSGNTGAATGDSYSGIEGVVGGAGSDVIAGDGGANALLGKAGNDTIMGKAGSDSISLGAGGYDVVRFDTALGVNNIDTITDFVVADDRIQLSKSIFTAFGSTGYLSILQPGAFNTGAAASQADDRIVYNSQTGALIYDANGDAAGGAVRFATLTAGLALTAQDFEIIA